MTTRRTAKVPLALIAVLVATVLPAFRATATSDETDWAKAFERAQWESPGFAVESVEEFRKLTEHYTFLLSDGVTVHSFELSNGDQIRCVEISSQRSLAASGHPLQLAPETPPAGNTIATARRPGSSVDRPGAEFGLDGTKDAAGNERACPAQSFPKLIPRLENLYHFRRLEDLFQKTPGGGGGRSTAPGAPVRLVRNSLAEPPHEYAYAYQRVNNTGMSADFNLWSPAVEQSSEFSLSQLWVARGQTTDNSLQTVETGWQNFQQLYGDAKSHLFIFYTTGNYQTGTKCYNLSCTAFVQTDSGVIIGGVPLPVYSTQEGPQYDISLAYFRDLSPPHNWWLKFNGTWVGYYPNSLFDSQGIANYSDHIEFGGEIVNNQTGGLHTTTDMGSGRFPSEGFGHAAYTKKIQYWDLSANQLDATGLTPVVTNASFYDLSLESSTDSNWLRYFYFGGPGRVVPSCTAIALSPASLPNGTAGAAYGPVTLTPTSGTSPFTFNIAGLPSGLSRTSAANGPNASIGGTPASSFSGAVTVSGTDANGCPFSQVFSLTVSVNVPGPTANFTFSPNPGTAGQTVQFTDESSGSPTSWSWAFGDGGASAVRSPLHTFASGTYQVSLTVSNSGGSSTKTEAVVVSRAQHKIVQPGPIPFHPQKGPTR